ncbi:MAG: hypothetical protein M3072_15595 [Candidatus Dormibacteraeota bacterium]|nr:hypothetical protein [Candidatus Dormibacteraeota bacterium]
MLQSANKSLVIAMFGYDDNQLNQVVHTQLNLANVYVHMSLDQSQTGGVHERDILKSLSNWENAKIGNSIAIGRSEKGAIMHLKLVIVDGLDVITGRLVWFSRWALMAMGSDLTDQRARNGSGWQSPVLAVMRHRGRRSPPRVAPTGSTTLLTIG